MTTQLITALDVDSMSIALELVKATRDCKWYKIGFQLFTRYGPEMVQAVKSLDRHVFLDLKFHDIPNTVGNAARMGAELGAGLMTLHACGGRKMIAAAREGVEGTDARILAVTVLTSISEDVLRNEVGLPETPEEAVVRYAKLAVDAGAHGLVASPHEITAIRDAIGPEPLIVTPGIRPEWATANDQARFMTPKEAAEKGADFIVVGRPITAHDYPEEAVGMILEELT